MIRIKSIEFINDEFFGNLFFDFTINDRVVDTIVFAGHNGSGKTRLLDFIYSVFNRSIPEGSINSDVFCRIVVEISDLKYYCSNKIVKNATISCGRQLDNVVCAVSFDLEDYMPGTVTLFDRNTLVHNLDLKSIFSTVDINYKPSKQINNVSSMSLDNTDTSIPSDFASDIIQLLVDLTNQDSNDIAQFVYDNPSIPVPEKVKFKRLNRFTKAFYHIFNKNLRFYGVENNVMPIFKKGDKFIPINDLSSGEKQIVFRGVYLLKNKESLNGAVCLVDEPEISMHPKWNSNIYDFYRRLFKTDKGVVTSQLFFATHSEYVINSAFDDKNCLIFKIENNKKVNRFNKNINSQILCINSSAAINYYIFDIQSTDFHIQLYSYIQNNFLSSNSTIKDVDDFLLNHGSPPKNYTYVDRYGDTKHYDSLCSYIRNCIDHPDSVHSYSKSEFETSLKFMINLINSYE